jgi:hypothetical protein
MRHNRHRRKLQWNNGSPKVLVLNKGYMPIDVKNWTEAVSDWYAGRADIVASYEDVILHSGKTKTGETSTEMPCPSIIRMLDNISGDQGALVNVLPMTRKNILERDHSECAYCGTKLTLTTMTIDHVYPISKGGLNDWANVRACCLKCNGIKDNKTLSELGWKLKRRVGVPSLSKKAPRSVICKIGGRILHESWRPYIYWSVEQIDKLRDI